MLIFKAIAVISVTASYLRGGGFSGGIGFVGAASAAWAEEEVVGSDQIGDYELKLDQDTLDGIRAVIKGLRGIKDVVDKFEVDAKAITSEELPRSSSGKDLITNSQFDGPENTVLDEFVDVVSSLDSKSHIHDGQGTDVHNVYPPKVDAPNLKADTAEDSKPRWSASTKNVLDSPSRIVARARGLKSKTSPSISGYNASPFDQASSDRALADASQVDQPAYFTPDIIEDFHNESFTSISNSLVLTEASTSGALILRGNGEIDVSEEEEVAIIPFILAAAVIVDQVFNEGAVTDTLAIQAVHYLDVINTFVAAQFKRIAQLIYDGFENGLNKYDGWVKDWYLGTKSFDNMYSVATMIVDLAKNKLGFRFTEIQEQFQKIEPYISLIRDGLDAIGAGDYIKGYLGTPNQVHNQYEFDKIDDKANNCGFVQFSNALKSGNGPTIIDKLKKAAEQIFTSLHTDPSTAIDQFIDVLRDLSAEFYAPLRCWLETLDGLGSIQFIEGAGVSCCWCGW